VSYDASFKAEVKTLTDLGWLVLGQAESSGSSSMAAAKAGKQLIDAAQAGDAARVAALLDGPLPSLINAKNSFGYTALIAAAISGHGEVVALLLRKGAGIEARDKKGWTALIHSAASGRREVVALLLGRGARTEDTDIDGWTALIHSAARGHPEVVALLLERGADPSARDLARYQTAEHWARSEEIKELLRVRQTATWGGGGAYHHKADDAEW
jgi:uncharacterized protein